MTDTSLSRRTFLTGTLAGAAAPMIGAPVRKKNVLFIASDDLNNCLGCYGHPIVRSPNIDRIAKSGVHFEHSYCQYPLCSPSRSSLMTGMAPDTTGIYELQTHFRKNLPDVVTLPQLFQKNGYFAARSGKIYHYGVPADIGTSGLDDPPSWNKVVNPAGVDHTKEEPLLTNHTPDRKIGNAICFHASAAGDSQHTDGMTADAIVQMMSEHQKEPWFLGAGFYRPHVPWVAPAKYFDLYPMDKIQATPFEESEMKIAPEWAYFTKPANWGMNVQQRREAIRAYYACITFMDAQVGKLLDALDKMKLTDNTTIVFWGDNGYHLGEHGQWMKQTVFEQASRIPLIFGGAGVPSKGHGSTRTVELLDIYPTLAEICELEKTPTNLQGTSLMPLLKDANAAWVKPAISQISRAGQGKRVMGYSLRTERYRYSMWNDGSEGEELYDYQSDPRELHNLAKEESATALKQKLNARLLEINKKRKAA